MSKEIEVEVKSADRLLCEDCILEDHCELIRKIVKVNDKYSQTNKLAFRCPLLVVKIKKV